MSADVVIRAEGVGKRYVIGHQAAQDRHGSFRDMLSGSLRRAASSIVDLGQGRMPVTASATTEEFWALKDVSFDIKRGEVVGIIGRNGAGKSTLLKVLSRITEPSAGRVSISGRVASLLEVGTGFHPELTGRENVYLNGAILGMTRAEIRRKFDEIVSFAEVERFLDTPVKRYSSGMYVRLAFAVAAHLEPEILVVDEVLAVGDAEFQVKCMGKMSTVARSGRTVLFVSHNTQAVSALCSRVIWLDRQRVAMEGTAEEVFTHYLRHVEPQDISAAVASLPDDPLFRLAGVELRQGEHPVIDRLDAQLPLTIRVTYEVKRATVGLRVLFQICDVLDNVVLVGFHDEDQTTVSSVKPGLYVSTATIPANIMAPVPYRLKIQAGIHNGRPVMPLEGLVLNLQGHRPYQGPPEYAGLPFAGRVAPPVAWHTETIGH